MRARAGASPVIAAAVIAGCSWTAFDDLAKDTPVTVFTNRAFGARVAIATDRDGAAILGSGGLAPDGASFYPLLDGRSEPAGNPIRNEPACALSSQAISAGRACVSSTTLSAAGVLVDAGRARPGCFAVGYGRITDGAGDSGPVVTCADGSVFTLATPPGDPQIAKAFATLDEPAIRSLRIATATVPGDGVTNPPLVLGSEVDGAAWWYPFIVSGQAPEPLPASVGSAGRYGAAVAVAPQPTGPVYLVSAPSAGKVYAFASGSTPGHPPTHVGCLEGSPGFGETLATGDLDLDGATDVLASDGGTVRVFLGKDRPTAMAPIAECGATWPASSIVLRCEDFGAVSGCASADFGRSIAVGDFDVDGRPDVAVGAPNATAEGVANAGAVFLFTPTVSGPNPVVDVRFAGRPVESGAFGYAVASGKVGGQDTLAATALGEGRTYVLWCTGLPGSPGGPRCRR